VEHAFADIHKKNSCQANLSPDVSLKKIPCGDIIDERKIQSFEEESIKLKDHSLKAIDSLREDKEFQTLLSELQNQAPSIPQSHFEKTHPSDFYIFVSFSMGEKALLNLAQEAKEFGATIILRGFKDKSYKKTAKSLQKIIEKTGQGFLIDPEIFSLFNVTSIPTIILSAAFANDSVPKQTPIHDRMQGHVSLKFALETFAIEGDLNSEAKTILRQGQKK
jgi:type-F conjugative transfer system pilin assembly protein TrbC